MTSVLKTKTTLNCDIKNLNVYYGDKQALRNISLTIPSKGVTAILGPSGCGKSTLLNCLNRLSDLNPACRVDGTIDWSDHPVYPKCNNSLELRKHIGYIAQQPNPFPTSIRKNFYIPLKEHGYHKKSDQDVVMEEYLEKVGLFQEIKDQLDQHACNLSGGQQQRLCLARALSLNPKAILMDEPTSSLDPISMEKIESLIHDLKNHYTIILVTHNVAQAKRIADNLAIFWTENNTGICLESGPKKTLLEHATDPRTISYLNGLVG